MKLYLTKYILSIYYWSNESFSVFHEWEDNEIERPNPRIVQTVVTFISHGANHDLYGKNGKKIPIPRHAEINELLAKSILKKAKNF